MSSLVASLGTSPGGILETFLYLRSKGEDVRTITVVKTTDPGVSKAYDYLLSMFSCCVKLKYSDVILEPLDLPFSDITSSDDLIEMRNLVEEKITQGDYVDITGGRKAISMVMGMIAMKKKAKIITTIVSQKSYNQIQEKMKQSHPPVQGKCSDQDKEFFCSLIANDSKTIEISL